jgi:hypothetical protein
LLNLPAEIRVMIWGFAVDDEELYLSRDQNPLDTDHIKRDLFLLLRVCRQLYSEAAFLTYTQNLFFFEGFASFFAYTRHTLLKYARHVEVQFTTCAFAMIKVPPATLRNLCKIHLELYECECRPSWQTTPSKSTIEAHYRNIFANQQFSLAWNDEFHCQYLQKRFHD